MDLKSFAGIMPATTELKPEVFEEIYNDDVIVLQTKKVYEHTEKGLNFKYRYFLRIYDWSEMIDCISPEHGYMAELFLVPMPESLNNSKLNEIKNDVGDDEIDYFSAFSSDCFMRIAWTSGLMEGDKVDDSFTEAEIPETIALVSNVVDMVDSMLGFYLDKTSNSAGNTNWDLLKTMIKTNTITANEFHAVFALSKMETFSVNYYTLGSNKEPHFSTKAGRFNQPKTDYCMCGQAQEEVLGKKYPTARKFYDKWDKRHLNELTADEYQELINDMEELFAKYPYLLKQEESGRLYDIKFWEIKDFSMTVYRRGSKKQG